MAYKRLMSQSSTPKMFHQTQVLEDQIIVQGARKQRLHYRKNQVASWRSLLMLKQTNFHHFNQIAHMPTLQMMWANEARRTIPWKTSYTCSLDLQHLLNQVLIPIGDQALCRMMTTFRM